MITGMPVTGPLRLQPLGCAEIGCRLPTQPLNLTQELTKDSLTDARSALERHRKIIIESWCRHYNAVGPHMSLNYLKPLEFKSQHLPATHQPSRAVLQE